MKRALVLGGGGAVGIAWETGVVAGLLDEGIDVRIADLVVGTSAGSVVGTSLALGRDPRDLLQQAARASNGTPPRRPADPDAAMAVFRMWGRIQKFTDEEFAEVGRAAAALDTMSEDEWLAGFSDNAWPGWPEQPLVICAVDCESGALRAFDATDGVPIERAVAASCAVPGMFPPVTIGRRRYTDGGLRSGTSADLAGRIDPDVVLIIAPMGVGPGGVNRIAAHQLAREIPALERGGAAVTLVQFDDTVRAAIGASLMDPAGVAPAREGGRANGRRLAQDLRATWMR